jgi:xanthine dehydrogenase YagT iron-sulfur-binding subunit
VIKEPSKTHSPLVDVGQRAPSFSVIESDGRTICLADFAGQPVVVALYPDEWDPTRPQQLAIVNEVLAALPQGVEALSIAREGHWCDLDFGAEGNLRFPLLQDSSGEISKLFGVTGQQGLFVINGDGIVEWSHVGSVGSQATADGLLSALEKIQGGKDKPGLSRRTFMVTAVAASFALAFLPRLSRAAETAQGQKTGELPVTLKVNGKDYKLELEPRVTLLDALRERIGLTGTKKGCDHGQCGACTVLSDGQRINSCLALAVMQQGKRIETVEGLAKGEQLHPVQAAFIKHDGFQCGYCTSGQIMSAVACIKEGHATSEEEIKTWMSGNICRCGAYIGIREAIMEARQAMALGVSDEAV